MAGDDAIHLDERDFVIRAIVLGGDFLELRPDRAGIFDAAMPSEIGDKNAEVEQDADCQ